METKKHKQLIIQNDIPELNRVVAFLEGLEEEWQLPLAIITPINLVLEEALSNVIFYAYEKGSTHEIKIDFEHRANQLDITITDTGKPFDPTGKEDPDIELSVEERPIGGLGIFLIRKIMNEVSYERVGQENILRMTKIF
ncbi:MAG: ATP-binding protein [Paludibacter sp.]|jgi:anti-sigma regulatory factor (Ser/Thr protein kinase)|nr:ATP-binding protein [Paludibacter sp.]